MATLPARDEPPRIPGFVIERELGRGAMSVVYLARQPNLDRRVALKVVRSGPAAGSREYARWLREGRSFSLLRHENVVRPEQPARVPAVLLELGQELGARRITFARELELRVEVEHPRKARAARRHSAGSDAGEGRPLGEGT